MATQPRLPVIFGIFPFVRAKADRPQVKTGAAKAGLFLMALGLASMAPAADLVDFAPMDVGNRWTYAGTFGYSSTWSSSSWTGIRVLEVLTRRVDGDTIRYTVDLQDTLHLADTTVTRTTLDLAEGPNGRIHVRYHDSLQGLFADGMLQHAFYRHSYPESYLVASVPGQPGIPTVSFEGSRAPEPVSWPYGTATYVQGIGLWKYSIAYAIRPVVHRSYQLIAYTVKASTGLAAVEGRAGRSRIRRDGRAGWRFEAAGRDAMGRVRAGGAATPAR